MAFLAIPLVVGLAFIPAYIAKQRGHSFGAFFVLGLFFFVPTLLAVLCAGDLAEARVENEELREQMSKLRRNTAEKEAAWTAEKNKAPEIINPVCPQCGHENAKEKVFCSKCGTKLESLPNPKEERFQCRRCNAPMGEGEEFCGRCGAAAVAEAATEARVAAADGRVECPKCGARQLSSRETCYRCGLTFVYSEDG